MRQTLQVPPVQLMMMRPIAGPVRAPSPRFLPHSQWKFWTFQNVLGSYSHSFASDCDVGQAQSKIPLTLCRLSAIAWDCATNKNHRSKIEVWRDRSAHDGSSQATATCQLSRSATGKPRFGIILFRSRTYILNLHHRWHMIFHSDFLSSAASPYFDLAFSALSSAAASYPPRTTREL